MNEFESEIPEPTESDLDFEPESDSDLSFESDTDLIPTEYAATDDRWNGSVPSWSAWA